MSINPIYRNPEGRPVVGPWQCPCKECTAPQESTDDQTDSLLEAAADIPCVEEGDRIDYTLPSDHFGPTLPLFVDDGGQPDETPMAGRDFSIDNEPWGQ